VRCVTKSAYRAGKLATVGFVSSPRARRRLIQLGALAAVAGVVALVVVLIPNKKPPAPEPVRNEGAAQVATHTTHRVSAADRAAINGVLDRFITAAVPHRDALTGWRLAGPEMKASSSLAEWRRWNVPVPYYPVRGTTFHDWTIIDVGRDYVDFNLLVHPRHGSRLGDYVFDGQMIRRSGKWLVNRLYTIAIMNPVRGAKHEIGPADFNAPPPSTGTHGQPVLGNLGLLPVVGILVLIVLVPVGLGVIALLRARRWRRKVRSQGRSELPPLPASLTRRDSESEREPASRL
jgi:hypothetical protein